MAHLFLKIVLLFLFSFQYGFSISTTQQYKIESHDSILSYIKHSQDKSIAIGTRISFIDSVYFFSVQTKNDSLKSEALKQYVKLHYKQKDWELFHKFRREHLLLTHKLKDSAAYAKTLEYSGAYFMNHHKVDSAFYYYYKSYKVFAKLKDSLKAGRILINLATLQKRSHDYIGSEATSFKAIAYLKPSKNLRRISSAYNNLGLIYEQLNDIDNAIKYHTKTLKLRKQIKITPIYQIHSFNNIGLVYTKNHKYDEAKVYFEKALAFDSVLQSNPIIKAYLIDNYTYARFKKGETKNILKSFLEALSIREKENHLSGVIINCIHLAEYYNKIDNSYIALRYAKKAEKISKSIGNYQDYLMAIELLSNLHDTKEAKNTHFKKYISIRDSLDLAGRNHKEQFARIQFETDEKERKIQKQENELIKTRNTITITFIAISLITIIIIFFFIHKKRALRQSKAMFKEGFDMYLKKKYLLTSVNFEFWKILITGASQEEIAAKLNISIDGIKSRRRTLKNKIHKVEKIKGDFDKAKAIILYNKELELYNNLSEKESK